MKKFHFRLDGALAWRRSQLELEQQKLTGLCADVERARIRIAALRDERARAECELREASAISGHELAAHANYRRTLTSRIADWDRERRNAEQEAARQRTRVAEAERRVRLLEKLRERRWDEWNAEVQRELDNLATDAYLARWKPH